MVSSSETNDTQRLSLSYLAPTRFEEEVEQHVDLRAIYSMGESVDNASFIATQVC